MTMDYKWVHYIPGDDNELFQRLAETGWQLKLDENGKRYTWPKPFPQSDGSRLVLCFKENGKNERTFSTKLSNGEYELPIDTATPLETIEAFLHASLGYKVKILIDDNGSDILTRA